MAQVTIVWYGTVGFNKLTGRFYESGDSNNSVTALKDNGKSTKSWANPTRLSSCKVLKELTKKIKYT